MNESVAKESGAKEHFAGIIASIGEDLNRPGLQDTPERAAKAFQFLTRGYNQTIDEVVNGALFPSDSSEMILVKDIELYSMCEHHLMPFYGKAHLAYIPNGKVTGLSKLARTVEVYSRRPQIQERLTVQIADALERTLDPVLSLLLPRMVSVRFWRATTKPSGIRSP